MQNSESAQTEAAQVVRYTNPILFGDYSDPDVIRVGDDFYMVSSSFTYLPGIPVLHSRDLVHWEIIGHAAHSLPFSRYDRPAHKCGTWAPSIRWHHGMFYVFVCLPDEGLLAFTAQDPAGRWECHYVKDVTGWIDPCPFFDDDGQVWLVHGFAASRAGINNILYLHRMSSDALRVLDKGRVIFDGTPHGDHTIEGPKVYKRDGVYWIFCPAGGVEAGYQLALRSENLAGPYERRIVLSQGKSRVNGPHQGGLVDDGQGRDWFIHFQHVNAYGRVPHLQPVEWADGWPVVGKKGTPVPGGQLDLPPFSAEIPMSDRFEDGIGLQWQWQANPNCGWYADLKPGLRLFAHPAENPFSAGNFLSQLMQYQNFDMDVQFAVHGQDGDQCGVAMMGYTYYSLTLGGGRVVLKSGIAQEVNRWVPMRIAETSIAEMTWLSSRILFRMRVNRGNVSFFYGEGQQSLKPIGGEYPMACGGWTGARPGLFNINTLGCQGGWADVAQVTVTQL